MLALAFFSRWLCTASIYFEKVIKAAGSQLTIWDRNFQLAFYSALLFAGMVAYDAFASGVAPGGGWTLLSLAVAVLGALGGVLVALSVKEREHPKGATLSRETPTHPNPNLNETLRTRPSLHPQTPNPKMRY